MRAKVAVAHRQSREDKKHLRKCLSDAGRWKGEKKREKKKSQSCPSQLNDPIGSDVKGVDGNDASVISAFKHEPRIREKG